MKHFIRKIIALLLSGSIVTLSVPMIHSQAAQEMWLDGEENGFKYSINLNYGYTVITGYTEITGYDLDKGVVEIPSEILGNPVTTIGLRAFIGCGHTDEYYHANDIPSEETHGCSGCGIKEIIIPDSVTTIEAEAFYDCESLTKIHFPSGLKDFYGNREGFSGDAIGYASWITGCDSLRELTISEDNPYYQSKNGIIYSKDGKTIGPVPPAIPFDSVDFDGITAIGDFAFCCRESEEKEFVIPEQITSIGAYAFFGCCNEAYWEYHDESVSVNIQLNEGLTSIGDYAFSNIGYLREMELPDSLLTLGKAAFSSTSLESMTIPSKITVIPDSLFKDCIRLNAVTLPEGITEIGEWAFYHLDEMTNIKLPSNLKTIGAHAFQAFGGTTINIPDSVEYIGEYAFYGNKSLASVKLSKNITKIEPYTFLDCGLESITIPEGVTEIGEGAFRQNHLTSVKLPETLRKIDNEAFAYGFVYDFEIGTRSVMLPDHVTEIGAFAFADCELGDIKLPENLISCGFSAFQNNMLSAIEFPEGIENLTAPTIMGNENINRIYLPRSLKELSPLAIAKNGDYYQVVQSEPYDVNSYRFYNIGMVDDIYFAGTEEEWNALTKDWDFEEYNTDPSVMDNVTVHFNATVGSDVKGDVNADGVFNVADVVMMQRWLLGKGRLVNWKAGDLCQDNIINVFDLCIMKRMMPTFKTTITNPIWNAETRTITADVTYENRPEGSDAWIGVVPSDTPHNEKEADAASIQVKWLSGFESGSFDGFLLSDNSLSGNYDLRIYSNDNGGGELACVTFYIDGPRGEITNIQWNADTRTVTADVTYANFPAVSNAWIGVVPSDAPHNELDADRVDVAYIALTSFESGSFPGIKVPDGISGSYDLRMYSNDNGGRELASVTFTIS